MVLNVHRNREAYQRRGEGGGGGGMEVVKIKDSVTGYGGDKEKGSGGMKVVNRVLNVHRNHKAY